MVWVLVMSRVVDPYGLVLENEFLVAYIPATERALVFRVRSRINKGFERFNYGPIPIPAGIPLPSYAGGSITVPSDGVMPMLSYIPHPGISFPMRGAYDETDMWYMPSDYRDRLFHVILDVTPKWLRIDVTIPKGVSQGRFQKDKITTGIDRIMGFTRGRIELIHFPKIYYGYRFGNDSNLNVYTGVSFTYAEYVVEIPKNEDLIFNILTRNIPSKWVTMPINIYDSAIRSALLEVYGIEGFTLYPANARDKALQEYRSLIGSAKI